MSARFISTTVLFAGLFLAAPVSAQEVNRPPAGNASALRQVVYPVAELVAPAEMDQTRPQSDRTGWRRERDASAEDHHVQRAEMRPQHLQFGRHAAGRCRSAWRTVVPGADRYRGSPGAASGCRGGPPQRAALCELHRD